MTMTHLELPHNIKLVVKANKNKKCLDFNSQKEILLENIQEKIEINRKSKN